MGQKDISQKVLEAYNDVFADIVNVLLFDGEEVIKPDELIEQNTRSGYKADGQYHEMDRDVAKRWKKENIRLACIGLENQTDPDKAMPLRIMGYDGNEYRTQLIKENKQESFYPVVTLVLYFGHEKHWDQPLSLHEVLDIPEDFKPYVNDYKVHLFEIAFLSEETVNKFKSDFRYVADFFVQIRKNGDYIPPNGHVTHIQEILSMLSIMSGDPKIEEKMNQTQIKEGDDVTMCTWFSDKLDAAMAQGMEQGISQTLDKAAKVLVERGTAQNMTEAYGMLLG